MKLSSFVKYEICNKPSKITPVQPSALCIWIELSYEFGRYCSLAHFLHTITRIEKSCNSEDRQSNLSHIPLCRVNINMLVFQRTPWMTGKVHSPGLDCNNTRLLIKIWVSCFKSQPKTGPVVTLNSCFIK